MSEPFDPYYTWLGIPPHEQPANHYRLLGISVFEASADVISNAADRVMLQLRAFQAGQRGKESQQLLNEVAGARLLLLDPEKKATYDADLRAHQPGLLSPPAVPPPAAPPVGARGAHAEAERIEGIPAPSPTIQIQRPTAASASPRGAARVAARRRKPTPAIVIVALVAAALVALGGGIAFVVSRISGFHSSAAVGPRAVMAGYHLPQV